jgi:hypothetical protein
MQLLGSTRLKTEGDFYVIFLRDGSALTILADQIVYERDGTLYKTPYPGRNNAASSVE